MAKCVSAKKQIEEMLENGSVLNSVCMEHCNEKCKTFSTCRKPYKKTPAMKAAVNAPFSERIVVAVKEGWNDYSDLALALGTDKFSLKPAVRELVKSGRLAWKEGAYGKLEIPEKVQPAESKIFCGVCGESHSWDEFLESYQHWTSHGREKCTTLSGPCYCDYCGMYIEDRGEESAIREAHYKKYHKEECERFRKLLCANLKKTDAMLRTWNEPATPVHSEQPPEKPKERKRVSKASTDPAAELRKAVLQAVIVEPGLNLVQICKRIEHPTSSIPCRVDELVQTGELERRTEDGKGNVGYYYYRNTAREVQPVEDSTTEAPVKPKAIKARVSPPSPKAIKAPKLIGPIIGKCDCGSDRILTGPGEVWCQHCGAIVGIPADKPRTNSKGWVLCTPELSLTCQKYSITTCNKKGPCSANGPVYTMELLWGSYCSYYKEKLPIDFSYTPRDPGFAEELLKISEEQWYPPVGVCWICRERVYPGEEVAPYRANGNTMKASDGRVFHESCFDKWEAENKTMPKAVPAPVEKARVVCAMVEQVSECVYSSLHDDGHFVCSSPGQCKGPYPADKYQVTDGVLVRLARAIEVLEDAQLARPRVQATLGEWIPRLPKAEANPELPKHRRRDAGMSQRVRHLRELRSGAIA